MIKKQLLVGLASIAVVVGIAGAVLYSQTVSADVVPTNTGKYADPTKLTLTEVKGDQHTEKIAGKLEAMGAQRFKTDKVDERSASDLFILSETILKEKAQDNEFHAFLNSALENRSKIITTGGDTSALIDVLKEAGVIPEESRNPMQDGRLIVGFALAENGTPMFYGSNLPEEAGQIEYLLEWVAQ